MIPTESDRVRRALTSSTVLGGVYGPEDQYKTRALSIQHFSSLTTLHCIYLTFFCMLKKGTSIAKTVTNLCCVTFIDCMGGLFYFGWFQLVRLPLFRTSSCRWRAINIEHPFLGDIGRPLHAFQLFVQLALFRRRFKCLRINFLSRNIWKITIQF